METLSKPFFVQPAETPEPDYGAATRALIAKLRKLESSLENTLLRAVVLRGLATANAWLSSAKDHAAPDGFSAHGLAYALVIDELLAAAQSAPGIMPAPHALIDARRLVTTWARMEISSVERTPQSQRNIDPKTFAVRVAFAAELGNLLLRIGYPTTPASPPAQ